MVTWDEIWPLFGLRIRSGPLELSPVHDDDVPALAQLAIDGIHDPDLMPFYVPWTQAPRDELPRRMAAHHWETRSKVTPDTWTIAFAVRCDGIVVGVQTISTEDYPVTRTGETGSWLGRAHQGKGVGTLMRQTICAFMFDHLGAEQLTSGAFFDNPASARVSAKLGYRPNGDDRIKRGDELATIHRFVLNPGDLIRSTYSLAVEGLAPTKAFLAIA